MQADNLEARIEASFAVKSAARASAPLHPGHLLQTRFLEPQKISQQQLAKELGISRRRVNEIIRGHRSITPDTAIRLGLFFGNDANFWMSLQNAWDMHIAWRKFTAPHAE
jgi:addiction module HigA family antidote